MAVADIDLLIMAAVADIIDRHINLLITVALVLDLYRIIGIGRNIKMITFLRVFYLPIEISFKELEDIKNKAEEYNNKINFIPDGDKQLIKTEFVGHCAYEAMA
jgi:hypothetical protein